MTVRSKLLAATSFSDTAQHDIYTVPTNRTAIVKGITVQNAGGSASHVTFGVKVSGTVVSIFSVDVAASGTAGACVILKPWLVLEPGNVLTVQFSLTGGWVTVSGAVLLGVAT